MNIRLESNSRGPIYFSEVESVKDFLRNNGTHNPFTVATLTLNEWRAIEAQNPGTNWKDVAVNLGVDSVEREGIDYNCQNTQKG